METKPPRKLKISEHLGRALLGAGPLRAAVEAILLAALLGLGLLLSSPAGQLAAVSVMYLIVGPLCAILYSARARLRSGEDWGRVLWREALVGTVLMALVTGPGIALVFIAGTRSAARFAVLELLWSLGAFAFFRTLAYLWPRWMNLRRRRLRWEMTHTTLSVVSAAVFLMCVVLALLGYGLSDLFSPGVLTVILPTVGLSVFLTVVALAFLLPPTALVSYFAARRTARRLEALVRGTSGLRDGNFSVRVEVDGEDEISDLQKDFNAMAGDLERAVRELRSERDRVEQLLATQRELVASVSHELRTPVATMRGYLESALEDRESRMPQDLRGDLEVTEREAVRLQRLIDDLFTLSRAETGRLPLEVQPTDAAALLARCAEAVSEGAWRTGRVEVVRDVPVDLPPISADEGRLEQAVRNLLQNAVRHTPPGGVVALGAAAEDDVVTIEVKDTGEGIAAGDLERVFERFYRSDGARQRDHSGAGLGLALVKELVEVMGGTVGAESEPGSGSRFTLSLPRA